MSESEPRRRRQRADYERGLPDHHDPTAGFGGAPPARSALTLRAWLAGFGLVVCAAGAVVSFVVGTVWLAIVLIVLAIVAVVDIVVIVRRKRRGEPG